MILSKLPNDVRVRLEEQNMCKEWTVQSLRDHLKTHITAREAAERTFPTSDTSMGTTRVPSNNYSTSYFRTQAPQREARKPMYTAGSLYAGERSPIQMKPKCYYCRKEHWSDECETYRTVRTRKSQIPGVCYICLKRGHTLRSCSLKKPCYHCG